MTTQQNSVRAFLQEQIAEAQQDGMKLGIKYGAKTLRGIADELDKEPANADYIRGLRDAAVFIENFAQGADSLPNG